MMNDKLINLYELAIENNIPIDEHCPEDIVAMSVCFPSGKKVISLSNFENAYDEVKCKRNYTKTECFAHEMGHCLTDSFYLGYSPYEVRAKHELRANQWATDYLIPFDELCSAVKKGYRELWELAEYFEVSCEFMEKAIKIHAQNGYIVPMELYMEY